MMESLREIFFKTGRIHYSMFDVGRSMFISFFFDVTGRFLPAVGLNPACGVEAEWRSPKP